MSKPWGPGFWIVIHSWALAYPITPSEKDQSAAAKYYNNLPNLLPCASCGSHFAEILLSDPVEPNLDSRMDLATWTWRVHNLVNASIGKPQLELDEFFRQYNVSVRGGQPEPSLLAWWSGKAMTGLYGMLAR